MREEVAVGWPRITGIHCSRSFFDLADDDFDSDSVNFNSREEQMPAPGPIRLSSV